MMRFGHRRDGSGNSDSLTSMSIQDHGRLGGRYNEDTEAQWRKHRNSLQRTDTRQSVVEKIPDTIRNHFIAMVGEFVGTVLFLFFAFSGTQTANSVNTSSGITLEEAGSNPQQLLYIAICFGFSLTVNAWTFFRISGGLFNPAVTVGLILIGAVGWVRGVLLFITQIIGGVVAAALVSCMFPGQLNVGTTLGAGTSTAQGLFIEMFLTAQLVFTIFMLAAEKHRGTFMAPVGIGLSLFIAELTGVHYTGGSLNPARSFGPCVATLDFPTIHWIYWLGPILGAIVAAGLYHMFKFLDYETANPGQDVSKPEEAEAEAMERRLRRKDSGLTSPVTSPIAESFWTGHAANAAAIATGQCDSCKAKMFERRGTFGSMSPTLRETASMSSMSPTLRKTSTFATIPATWREASPLHDVITADYAQRREMQMAHDRHVEHIQRPAILVTSPTPPVSKPASEMAERNAPGHDPKSGLTQMTRDRYFGDEV